MSQNLQNRMQKTKPAWTPAVTALVQSPPERAFVCVQCGSNRTVVRVTRPEHGITQMSCKKCGGKFAVRNFASPTPEARIIP